MAEEKKNPLGPTGDQVRSNVERLREARGLTKKDLSDRVAELGRPIPPLGISRIEAGTRRVDADDLTALAVALRVSPVTLLLPWTDHPGTTAEITGAGVVTADDAWRWADGYLPLSTSDSDPGGDTQRFRLDSRPAWARDWLRYVSWSELVKAVRERNARDLARMQEMHVADPDHPDDPSRDAPLMEYRRVNRNSDEPGDDN